MDKVEFKDNKQKEYFERTQDFIQSDKKVLVNPGGMGLGKTFATVCALENNIPNEQFSFIACPTSPMKNIWAKEFNRRGLLGKYMIWFSKDDCCIKKIEKPTFDPSKECDDDCKYRSLLEANGEPKLLLYDELNKIEQKLPFFPKTYYKNYGCEQCLLPISRYGLKKKKYLIGDYLGF